MASNLFQKLELEAFKKGITPRTKESRSWFRRQAQALGKINRQQVFNDPELKLTGNQFPGGMFMFFYDPKHKKTLPYYDAFPLTIIVEGAPGGFTGLNLHYLPMAMRAKFLDALMDVASDKKFDDNTKFSITHSMLKKASGMKYFKPCYKHYLTAHVRSRFARVPAPEWEIATFLPTQDFQKSSTGNVYSDSRRMI